MDAVRRHEGYPRAECGASQMHMHVTNLDNANCTGTFVRHIEGALDVKDGSDQKC